MKHGRARWPEAGEGALVVSDYRNRAWLASAKARSVSKILGLWDSEHTCPCAVYCSDIVGGRHGRRRPVGEEGSEGRERGLLMLEG